MKKTILRYTIILLIGMAFVLNSCKEECPCDDPTNPKCDNYDPCYGKDTINTFFKVRPGDRGFAPPEEWCELVPCDTFNASSVRFDIPEGNPSNSSYEWQVGSEAETRTGKAFEVDFSDYLIAGKWETWIPVTLTIRTPLNSCLENPKDTLVTVTRELFFTEKINPNRGLGEPNRVYTGTINGDTGTLEFILNEDNYFRGVEPPTHLIVGLPNYDTILYPRCRYEYCLNYRNIIVQHNHPNCVENIDFGLISEEIVFQSNGNQIRHLFIFQEGSKTKEVEFIGERH